MGIESRNSDIRLDGGLPIRDGNIIGERLLMPIRLAKQGRRGFQEPRRTVLGVVFGDKMLRVQA